MYGEIEYAQFEELTKMPQGAASAWSAFETSGLIGAEYKPVLYVGEQLVRGKNYIFIAEQILMDEDFTRRLVTIKINEFNGEYSVSLKPTVQALAF